MNILPATILGAILLAVTTAKCAFTYTTNEDGVSVTITGYTNSVPAEIVIPTNINGLTVTAIGEGAFEEIYGLTSVEIPSTVTTIGEGAFAGTGLTSTTIPYGVTNISEAAFEDCESLTNVIIPESVTYIGQGAFADIGITRIIIPSSVSSMGDGAFVDCGDLTNLVISYGISSLQTNLFVSCYNCRGASKTGQVL